MEKENIFTFKAYGKVDTKTGRKILPVFDEMEIRKTKRKKIQILVSGKEKKGIANNEQSELFQFVQNFFLRYGFSFGIEISLFKNIPQNAGLGENFAYIAGLILALEKFSGKKISENMFNKNLKERQKEIQFFFKNTSPCQQNIIEIIYFPKISFSQEFIEKSLFFREKKITPKEFILECFYEIHQKFLVLEEEQKIGKIQEFGFIGIGPSIFVIQK